MDPIDDTEEARRPGLRALFENIKVENPKLPSWLIKCKAKEQWTADFIADMKNQGSKHENHG